MTVRAGPQRGPGRRWQPGPPRTPDLTNCKTPWSPDASPTPMVDAFEGRAVPLGSADDLVTVTISRSNYDQLLKEHTTMSGTEPNTNATDTIDNTASAADTQPKTSAQPDTTIRDAAASVRRRQWGRTFAKVSLAIFSIGAISLGSAALYNKYKPA